MSSYCDVTYCEDYFSRRLYTEAWDASATEDKTKALAHATEILNGLSYVGSKAEDNQVNQFPRGDDTTVPDDIKKVTCLVALALLDGVEPEREFNNLFKTSHGYGGVRVSYADNTVAGHIASGVPSQTAWRLLFPYLRDPSAIKLNRVD